jgi:hypothetical protein
MAKTRSTTSGENRDLQPTDNYSVSTILKDAEIMKRNPWYTLGSEIEWNDFKRDEGPLGLSKVPEIKQSDLATSLDSVAIGNNILVIYNLTAGKPCWMMGTIVSNDNVLKVTRPSLGVRANDTKFHIEKRDMPLVSCREILKAKIAFKDFRKVVLELDDYVHVQSVEETTKVSKKRKNGNENIEVQNMKTEEEEEEGEIDNCQIVHEAFLARDEKKGHKYYTQLEVKGIMIKVGDCVSINATDENGVEDEYLAQVLAIFDDNIEGPMLEVKWFKKASDLDYKQRMVLDPIISRSDVS